jgi:tetratricopeptide (TPR) repeat protein
MSDLERHARDGIAAINERRYDDAIRAFESALAEDPNRPDMNNALGMAYLHRGDVGNAVAPLERAKTLSEAFSDAEHGEMKAHFFTGLATAYQLLDRVTEAKQILRETVKRFPGAVDAWVQLAQLYLESCEVDAGVAAYRAIADHPDLDADRSEAAEALAGAIVAFQESGHSPDIFIQAHRDEYVRYFDQIAAEQPEWYAEAARMARGADGAPKPILADGARPWALQRVDLVNPADGAIAGIHSDSDPLIVAVNGLEPLAQVPVMLPWEGHAFDVWVCTRCPWHWLQVIVQLRDPEAGLEALDETIGSWYLAGYNGDFGDAKQGRFHYATDAEDAGHGGAAWSFDLGRTTMDAIANLLNRLAVLHDRHPIRRVLLGGGRLPD